MPNVTGDQLTFNIDSISDNQILVYDGDNGIFVAQDSLAANSNVGIANASNVGSSGVGVFKEKDGEILKFKNIAAGTNTTVTEDSANGLIKINATQYSPSAPLSLHNNNGNVYIAQGQNYGANANVSGFIAMQSSNSYGAYSDSSTFDGHTRFRIGSNDLVDVELTSAHGLILSTAQNVDGHIQLRSNTNIEFYAQGSLTTTPDLEITSAGALKIGNNFTLPTGDGTSDQVLATYGNGVVYWKTITVPSFTESGILAKTVRLDQTSVPTVTQSYDIGSTTRQFYEVHARYFKGQADTAIQIYNNVDGTVLDDSYILGLPKNSDNLSGLSNVTAARENLSVYSKAEANALVSGATQTNSFVRITDGTNTATAANTNDVFQIIGGDDITVGVNATSKAVTISSTAVAQQAFKHVFVSGEDTISADSSSDGITFAAGAGISITTNAGTDTLTITNTGSGGGGGNVSEAFKNIAVSGQTTVAADAAADTVTFVAGSGMTITTDAGADSITFASTGGSGNYGDSNVASYLSTNGYSNVDNDAQAISITGNVISITGNASTVDLTSALGSVTSDYGNTQVQAYLDATGYSNVDNDSQTLSWDASTRILSISGGNSANLSVMEYSNAKVQAYLDAQSYSNVDNDSQAISIVGNVISITGNASTVDLTSALGSVTSDYGDSNVASFLSTNSYSNVAYGNTQVQNYLSASGYATQATIVAAITDSAPATLDTLNELAAALGDDPNFATTVTNSLATKANISSLANVATSGDFDDLINVPILTLSSSNLTFDGTTVDLSSVGAVGPQGNAGVDAPTISSASLSGDNLQLTLSNSTVLTAGNVRGPVGPTGATGVGITNTALVSSNLTITYSNTSVQDLGNIRGPVGPTGATGPQGNVGATGAAGADAPTISSASLSGDNLQLTLSNSDVLTAGNVRGAQGPAGNVLVTTSNSAPSGASEGQMWYATDDGHTYIYVDSAWVQANPGQSPQTISLAGNVLTISGSNSNVDFTSALAVNTDAQALSIVGNVISLTGGGSVDLTSTLSPYLKSETDSQDLSLSGNVISLTGQSGNVDLTSLLASGGSYSDSDVDSHLNQSNPTDGYVLSWTSGDYAWVAQSGGGGSMSDVVDDTSPQLGGDLDVNGQDIVTTSNADIDLDPDGSGVVVFKGNATKGAGQFKLNCENNSHGITIKGPPHSAAASYTLTLPNDDGSADQVLKTDGSGTLSWVDQSGGGGGSVTRATHWEEAKITYDASDNSLTGNANVSAGISAVTIPGSGYGVTFNFTGYTNPPHSIVLYGYDAVNNQYYITHVDQNNRPTMPGNGSAGSPEAFGDFSNSSITVDVSTTNTGGQRNPGGFGVPAVATHTWVRFIMGD